MGGENVMQVGKVRNGQRILVKYDGKCTLRKSKYRWDN